MSHTDKMRDLLNKIDRRILNEGIDNRPADLSKIPTDKLRELVSLHRHYGETDWNSFESAKRGAMELYKREGQIITLVSPDGEEWTAESELDEGYRILPPLDPGYEEREGLEGPINANGRPLYYDPKEGKYYDPRTDMYLDHDEALDALSEGQGDTPHFIERQGGLILWQLGHYHYVITKGTQPFELVKACPDCSAEEAKEILASLGSDQLDEISDELANRVGDARFNTMRSADRKNRDETMSTYDKFSKNQKLQHQRDARHRKAGLKGIDPRTAEYQNAEPGRKNFGDSVEPRGKMVDESWQDELLAMAQKTNPNARMRGSREEEMARTRDKLERNRAAATAPRKIEKLSPEQIDRLKAELDKLRSNFDSSYAYSDDHSVFSRNEPIDRRIKSIERTLRDQGEHLDEYASDLAKMKKADSYKVGDKIYTKVGGAWREGVITAPMNKVGNYGVKFQHKGQVHSYVSSPDQLRLRVEDQHLDELSKKTLGKYVRGATRDAMDKIHSAGFKAGYSGDNAVDDVSKAMTRRKGIDRATDRLALGYPGKHDDWTKPNYDESLNELSKRTLGSYVNSANLDAIKNASKAGASAGQGKWDLESHDKAFKRARGVAKATDRLMKEAQTDNIETMQNIVADHQATKVKFADGTSMMVDVQTADVILKVYEAVNPDNQAKLSRMVNKDRASFMRVVDFCWSKVGFQEDTLTNEHDQVMAEMEDAMNDRGSEC